ncbi:M1 family metallopeptidase [soil metagenome]
MRRLRPGTALPFALTAGLVLTACSGSAGSGVGQSPESAPTTQATSSAPDAVDATQPDLDAALSEPVEDSVYPDVGDPGVDALRYSLGLAWDPATDTLTGTETLTFRATDDADDFQLDFGKPLRLADVSLDGAPVQHTRDGKNLVIAAPVVADERYELVLDYAGTPRPVAAPTTRDDIPALGFTIDAEHQVWTMQEPFGAYSWYAVNDQPSDKAFYDFTLSVPSPWTGIANGEQTSSTDDGTTTTTTYELDDPAASYLATVAFGDYLRTDDEGPGGLPITYWTPRGRDDVLPGLQTSPEALAYLEEYLGPYPFETAGILVVDSDSGMETQTMITLGDTPYATEPATIVHEFAHQWYGDQVTPADWRDVWMNEGMAMYLQLMWQADQEDTPLDSYLTRFSRFEAEQRAAAGPPGDYDPTRFGESNIYYGPALMWHALRQHLGDEEFFAIVRGWPLAQDNTSTDRETFVAYIEDQSGEDLDDFFDAWLLGETTPE